MNLALLGLLPVRPRIVVAGVNAGSNLGDDVTYSGTVSAALEGALLGVPGLAVSLIQPTGPASYRPAARAAARLTRLLLREPARAATLLNVNVPPGQPRGVRLTRLGRRLYSEKVVERQDPARAALLLDRRRPARVGGGRGHGLRRGPRRATSR